jgi:glycosyltransferase involved in cell wall biosynthesis
VGTNEKVDQLLPKNVISIHRTQNQAELAEIYTAADLFLNPTREENFPTVHLESLACGTPILSFDTGGCGETFDATCGAMVPKNDVEGMYRKIMEIFNERPFTTELCLEYAKNHDQQHRFLEYISLYES